MVSSTGTVRSRGRALLASGAVLAVLGLFGCGITESDVGNGGEATRYFEGASTAAEMCETLPAAFAEHQARCHGGTVEEWLSFKDEPCAATARAESAGRITFDAARAQACLTFLATDDCIFQPGEGNPCNSLVTGSKGSVARR